jgi:hypothetical protein
MPCYRIRLINSEFESADEVDYPSIETARRSAIIGATQVLSDSVAKGQASVAVEIQIYEDDELTARTIVSLNVADLIDGD